MSDRFVVISLNAKTVDYVHNWAQNLKLPYQLQVPSTLTSHDIGESLTFAEYIVNNYDTLANYTVFLCDANLAHWHRPNKFLNIIRTARPQLMTVVGMSLADHNNRYFKYRWDENSPKTETCSIRNTLNAFNVTYDSSRVCEGIGNEFILSKRAIRSHPRTSYVAWRDTIISSDCSRRAFGYALDRTKSLIWNYYEHRCR